MTVEPCERSPKTHSESSTQPMTSTEDFQVEVEVDNPNAKYYNLLTEYNALQDEHDTLRAQYGTLKENYETLEDDHNDLQAKYKSLEIDFKQKKKLHSDLVNEHKTNKRTHEVLLTRFKDLVKTSGELNSAAIGTKRVLGDLVEFCNELMSMLHEDSTPSCAPPKDKKHKSE